MSQTDIPFTLNSDLPITQEANHAGSQMVSSEMNKMQQSVKQYSALSDLLHSSNPYNPYEMHGNAYGANLEHLKVPGGSDLSKMTRHVLG